MTETDKEHGRQHPAAGKPTGPMAMQPHPGEPHAGEHADQHAADANREAAKEWKPLIPPEQLVTRPPGYTPPPDKAAPRDATAPVQMSADQVATPPSSPPHLGGKQVDVIMGPYRGSSLIMPEAEADQAIADHWAVVPVTMLDPAAEVHPPLDDAEREAALAAAQAWADTVNEPPLPPDPPPEEPAAKDETDAQRQAREKRNAERRADYDRRKAEHDQRNADRHRKADDKALHPGGAGDYQTRAAAPPTAYPPPGPPQPAQPVPPRRR